MRDHSLILSIILADQIKATFHEYVRPEIQPELTPFCTELTGITQVRLASIFNIRVYVYIY